MLEEQRPLVGDDACRRPLLVHVIDERYDRRLVAVIARHQRVESGAVARRIERAAKVAHAFGEVRRARAVFAVPERHPRRRSGRRRHDHPIVLDRPDAPRARTELEDVADPRLVHELLVELTEPRPVGERHRVQAAIGNRAAGDHRRHSACSGCGYSSRQAVPRDLRFQRGRDVRRILAGQHRQRLVERGARQAMVRIRAPHEHEQLVGVPIVDARRGDKHLTQDVERVLHHMGRLDVAIPHRVLDGEDLQAVVAERRHEQSVARLA